MKKKKTDLGGMGAEEKQGACGQGKTQIGPKSTKAPPRSRDAEFRENNNDFSGATNKPKKN